jgi:hypothetical protein
MPIKDPGRLAALLDVVAKVATVAPRATHLSSSAMKEIDAQNEELRKEGLELAKKEEDERAKRDHEAAILAAGGPAKERLTQAEMDRQQLENDKKVAAEADRVAKEKFDREEAERRANDPHGLRPPPPMPPTSGAVRPPGQPAQRPEDVEFPRRPIEPRAIPSNKVDNNG